MRFLVLMTTLLMLALLMFGCGEKSEKTAAEKIAEKAIESNIDGDAKVELIKKVSKLKLKKVK